MQATVLGMSDAKLTQVLQIEPARELKFRGPFTDVVNASLTLRNPADKAVCFKVKTTAPKQYCVRPNSGIINPGESMSVTVMLQPLDTNSGDSARHKFMVQACYKPDHDFDLEGIWKTVGSNELMYSKLMVVFEESKVNPTVAPTYYKDETPASIQFSSPSASAPSRNNSTSASDKNELEDRLRTEVEIRKKLEVEQRNLRKELDELFKKNAKLQKDSESSLGEVGVPTIQVILLAIAGLLIGLIVGKLF